MTVVGIILCIVSYTYCYEYKKTGIKDFKLKSNFTFAFGLAIVILEFILISIGGFYD